MDITVTQNTALFLFIYINQPTVSTAISASVNAEAVHVALSLQAVSLDAQIYARVTAHNLAVRITALTPLIDIVTKRSISTERRMRRSAWQARLGARLDPIKRKLLDNNLLLSAHPTDMLRVRTIRDPRTQDVQSRMIVSAEILPILLPILTDIPMRRLEKDINTGMIVCSFSMLENQEPFSVFCPMAGQLRRDDLLFRILKDPYADYPYIMVLQVKDELATFSYSSLLYVKYNVTFYDEPLPSAVIAELIKASEKREVLQW